MICCEAFNLLVMTNVFIKIGLVETAKWIFAEANSAVDVDHDHVSLEYLSFHIAILEDQF